MFYILYCNKIDHYDIWWVFATMAEKKEIYTLYVDV